MRSKDCSRIVSASFDTTLKIWDVAQGAEVLTLKGHRRRVADCAWSVDARKVVSASWDATLILWNAETGKIIYTLRGHRGPVSSCRFSADGFWVSMRAHAQLIPDA